MTAELDPTPDNIRYALEKARYALNHHLPYTALVELEKFADLMAAHEKATGKRCDWRNDE